MIAAHASSSPSPSRLATFGLPLLTLLALSLPKLAQGEFSVDTGWYAAIAHQAWADATSGNPGALWTLMGIGGQDGSSYFNKPPLVFWIHGFLLWLTGPSLWAARLPSVIAAAACVVVLVAVARRVCGSNVALWAGIALATTIEFFRHTHALSLDLWHALFLFSAMALHLELLCCSGVPWNSLSLERDPRIQPLVQYSPRSIVRRCLLLAAASGLCLGLALMTKPLQGFIVVPMMIAASLIARRPSDLRYLVPIVVVAILVAAPWHLSMWFQHGSAFTAQYFGKEIADRATGSMTNLNDNAGDPLYYHKELLKTGWPWLAVTLLAFVAMARGQQLSRTRATAWILAMWVVVWFILLSAFPDKRPRYLLVIYPAAAWLSAMWLTQVSPDWIRRLAPRGPKWITGAAILAGILIAVLPVTLHRAPEKQWIDFFAFLRAHPDERVWQGGFVGARAARVYLETGSWPIPTLPAPSAGSSGTRLAEPPEGALIAYHIRDGLSPGPNETTVFESRDLKLTRRGPGSWQPITTTSK